MTADEMWTSLAPFYDRLFPPRRAQLDFITAVLGRLPHPARRLLDVGCATGGYAFALAGRGYEVTGVDLSPEMIRVARGRIGQWAAEGLPAETGPERGARVGGPIHPREPRFLVSDMTNLADLPFDERRLFEGVTCLSNTLAHLLSAAELGAALGEMARVLTPDGGAILQTVNYDRLAATGEMKFPPLTLEAAGTQPENLVFQRLYLPRADGLVLFVTSLQKAGSGRVVYRAETLLRPIVRDELAAVAAMAFHGQVDVYGDFLFSPWSEASPATVVVAGRGWD